MKRTLLFLGLMSVFAAPSFAQNQTVLRAPFENVAAFSDDGDGPCWRLPPDRGIAYHSIHIEVPAGVSAGTVLLQGSFSAACASPTDIIAAQDVTMVGAVESTEGVYPYVQLVFASYAGTGTVRVFYAGNKETSGGSITGTVTANLGAVDNAVLDAIAADIAAIEAGTAAASITDPCDGQAKTYVPINIATATTVELANAVASQHFYICGVNLVTAAANNVVIAADDTDGCGSITAGLIGGTTAASGWNFGANGGIALGNGGSTVMKTATVNHYLCILTSAATQLSGGITFVQAP